MNRSRGNDMDDLIQEMQYKKRQLDASLKQLTQNGTKMAQAEEDYKILLSKECLRLRDEGMAVGMIDKVCYGLPNVAKARFNRDVTEIVFEANKEAINVLKLEIRTLEEQIKREWGARE